MQKKIKVLYIGGLNRSGSTLLTKCLNEVKEAFSVNEIVFIGKHGLQNNFILGNGESFLDNNTWRKILLKAYGKFPSWEELAFFEKNIHKKMGLPLNFIFNCKVDNPELERYKNNIAKLYNAIAEVTKCTLIIDSSKSPDYAYLLSELGNIDIYLLHLTRDFRGIYYSQSKVVKRNDVITNDSNYTFMRRSSLAKFVGNSYITSLKVLSLKRKKNVKYLRAHYEDFCSDPNFFIKKVLSFIELNTDFPYISDFKIVTNKSDLGIWGNPMRLQREILIKKDEQWKKSSLGKKIIVTCSLYPLTKLFGYQ